MAVEKVFVVCNRLYILTRVAAIAKMRTSQSVIELLRQVVIMDSFKEKGRAYRKQLIADAAFRLFAHQSFETVTVDDIAEEAGCGKGTIYQYFGNKEQILNSLVYQGLDDLCSQIKEHCSDNPDILDAIEKYLELQFDFFLHYNQIFASWLRLASSKISSGYQETVDHIEAKFEEKLNLVAAIFDKGVEKKLLRNMHGYSLAKITETVARNCTFIFFPDKDLYANPQHILCMLKEIICNGILREKHVFNTENTNPA